MSDAGYVRLTYASEATFGSGDLEDPGTQRGVMDIVRASRRNNPAHGICGALQFANGYFLQVLEGEPGAVDELFGRIEADERHRNVRVLQRRALDAPLFAHWAMKFLSLEPDLARVIGAEDASDFDPYRLSEARLDELVEQLAAREGRD